MNKTKKSLLDKLVGWFIGILVLVACFILFLNVVLR